MSILSLIGRNKKLFSTDIKSREARLKATISSSSFLILGGAGSIGQEVVKEIIKRRPLKIHVIDLSENNLVELVRDIRNSYPEIQGSFQAFALDIGSLEYDAFIASDGKYDYVLNLSALKHVRSEKDPFTLMRMLHTNIFNTKKTLAQSIDNGTKKYFCVSTDKATNPENMMGASKKIMEMFLSQRQFDICISTARFANVAFSDGSLLHSFEQRVKKKQPIAAPSDIKRYFITPQESGELCLLACIFGAHREIYFPKVDLTKNLQSFTNIAVKYLSSIGYTPNLCDSERNSSEVFKEAIKNGSWPCLFTLSDTTGEKPIEEFFTEHEKVDVNRFLDIGIITNEPEYDEKNLCQFESRIKELLTQGTWTKEDIVHSFKKVLPNFRHIETGRNLNDKI